MNKLSEINYYNFEINFNTNNSFYNITYPVYRKNNKKLQEIDEAAHKYRKDEIFNMFMSKFTKKEVEHYENIGCPLQAIWLQDQGMQLSYWGMVQSFVESKGLKMRIKSMLD